MPKVGTGEGVEDGVHALARETVDLFHEVLVQYGPMN
jgi:hypothetical protein